MGLTFQTELMHLLPGGLSAMVGIVASALFDFPSGPSIVTVQFVIFILAVLMPKGRTVAHDY
ncbi:MAG: metal ABC transporter permease [Cyanobacteria bacterium P01_H01_bin.26]